MDLSDFDYHLPDELIARYPTEQRTASRLLALDKTNGEVLHHQFTDLIDELQPNDLLVFNNTRVIPARLFGEKASGGKVEVMIERITSGSRGIAQIRASKSPKPDTIIHLEQGLSLRVIDLIDDMFLIESNDEASLSMVLQAVGHMPLPPYIDREDETLDRERYQTVYSSREGAVAAPTAGLHFTEDLIKKIIKKGITIEKLTLNIGLGTFLPLREDSVEDNTLHSEYCYLSKKTAEKLNEIKNSKNRRIICVGTTALRTLETSFEDGIFKPVNKKTNKFIYPGIDINSIDALITNFHLPKSSLFILICALMGTNKMIKAYEYAIKNKYRFYSYGDACLLEK